MATGNGAAWRMSCVMPPGITRRDRSCSSRERGLAAAHSSSTPVVATSVFDADHELAEGAVVFHVGVRLTDVVEAVDVWRAERDPSRGDPVEIALKDVSGQVGAVATVRRQPHALGQVAD